MTRRTIRVRTRLVSGDAEQPTLVARPWAPNRTAAVICDMWDTHHCRAAAERVAEMAPRMNDVVRGLRESGVLIVHAPGGCMDFYEGTPARRRAESAPRVRSPLPIDWNPLDPRHEGELPPSLGDPGGCSCASSEPCGDGNPPYPWTRQIETIQIEDADAVTDDGGELLALLEYRDIGDVVVMGVHTNICVLAQPYGIRQLVYWGKNPVLCRDLTDSFHRDPRGHGWGTEYTVSHIERYWCPTTTSVELVGGEAFSFGRESAS